MKILSEKTGKEYMTVEDCLAAEKEFDKAVAEEKVRKENLAKERKERAAEVEAAYEAILEAQKAYRAKLDAFVKDYGSFHMTVKTGEGNPFNLFEPLFSFPRLF